MAPVNARERMAAFLGERAGSAAPMAGPSPEQARRLLARTQHVPLFAHSYPFILNMDHGGFSPTDLAEFAYANDLDGLCLHINDGGERSVAAMNPGERDGFRALLENLKLKLHLEISSTTPEEVDLVTGLAGQLGVTNIRFYARYQGPLGTVLKSVYADLAYAMERANAHDLHFDYEQHEDLRADEIAGLMHRIGDPRLNVLFDYTNSWNAYQEPLAALRILSPWIRQVHIKGGRKTEGAAGWGQVGVPQGAPDDELPSALLLHELLLLGDDQPQVIAFALENEVGYVAPPFRGPHEPANPIIAAREPSQTLLADDVPLAQRLRDEQRWAQQQVTFNRQLVAELRLLAAQVVEEADERRPRPIAPRR